MILDIFTPRLESVQQACEPLHPESLSGDGSHSRPRARDSVKPKFREATVYSAQEMKTNSKQSM